MIGYELLSLEKRGGALAGRVRFEAPDGRTRALQLSWPVETTLEAIEAALRQMFLTFLKEPPTPAPVHEAMALVGKPEDLSHLVEPL